MVLEMWTVTDKMFCHFGFFFALLPFPLHTPNDPENQNFDACRHYHFTHMYHKLQS